MSSECMGAVWNLIRSGACDLSPCQRLVLLAMADVANEDHEYRLWMTQATIASKTGYHRQAVNKAVRSLVDIGVLSVVESVTGSPNVYQLDLSAKETGRTIDVSAAQTGGVRRADTHVSAAQTGGVRRADTELKELNGVTQRTKTLRSKPNEIDFAFEKFWSRYPRKIGKRKAESAYRRALDRTDCDIIDDGLERWVAYWDARGEPEYIPHPTTWLNDDRWEADPPPPPKRKGRDALEFVDTVFDTLERSNGQ